MDMDATFRYERQIFSPTEFEFLRLYLQLDEDRRAILRLIAQAFLEAQPKKT